MTTHHKVQHTPGPWLARTSGEDARVVCADGRSFLVGDLLYHPENVVNARLIAAAPDLLKAAKAVERAFNLAMMRGQISAGTENSTIANELRAAIAKAEG